MNRQVILVKGLRIRRWALLAAIFGTPVIFLRTLNDSINVPKLSLLMACVAVAVGMLGIELTQGRSRPRIRLLAVPLTAALAPLALAWLLSPYRTWSWFGEYTRFTGLLPYLVVGLLFVLIVDAFAGDTLPVALSVAGAGGVAGLYALIQKVGLDPFTWSIHGAIAPNVVTSTLGNPDFVGGLLAICLPVTLALWFHMPERRGWITVGGVLVAGGCLVSFSQGGWVALMAGAAVTGSFVLAPRISFARVAGLLVAGGIACAGVGAVLVGVFASDAFGPTATRRADWWEGAATMTAAHPIIGRGPSSFAIEHSRYRTLNDAREANHNLENDPHNLVLAFSTGAGLIGGLGIVVFMGWGVRRGIQLSDSNILGAGFFGAFAAYIVQALVSIDTVALRTAGWAVLAAMVASTQSVQQLDPKPRASKKRKPARAQPLRNPALVVVIAFISLAGIYWSLQFALVDDRFANARSLLASGNVTEGQAAYEPVLGFRRELEYERTYARDLGRIAIAAAYADRPVIAAKIYDLARAAFDVFDELSYVTPLVEHARFLRDWGSADPETDISDPAQFTYDPDAEREALTLFERAVTLDPLNEPLLNEAADLALDMEEFETVVRILGPRAEIIESPVVWGELALAEARMGRRSQAQQHANAALRLDPEQPLARTALDLLKERK